MKTIKVIFKSSELSGVEIQKTVGAYTPEKITEAIDQIKKVMLDDGYELIKDYKDCCNYQLIFDKEKIGSRGLVYFHTEDCIINELNL